MRRLTRAACAIALVSLLAASVASAQPREFTGQVVAIDAASIVVRNRMGERVGFARAEKTSVVDASGAAQTGWSELRTGDRVIVRWNMRDDGPREAHRVIVLPPR